MLAKKDLMILARLRQNARESLTTMSRKTQLPISTIHDRMRSYQEDVVKKHTSLIDFSKIGYHTRANIAVKVERSRKEELKEYLKRNLNTNTVYKINNGYDFLIEGIFRHVKDLEEFLELLEEKFAVKDKTVYYIIDDIKREEFLNDEKLVDVLA